MGVVRRSGTLLSAKKHGRRAQHWSANRVLLRALQSKRCPPAGSAVQAMFARFQPPGQVLDRLAGLPERSRATVLSAMPVRISAAGRVVSDLRPRGAHSSPLAALQAVGPRLAPGPSRRGWRLGAHVERLIRDLSKPFQAIQVSRLQKAAAGAAVGSTCSRDLTIPKGSSGSRSGLRPERPASLLAQEHAIDREWERMVRAWFEKRLWTDGAPPANLAEVMAGGAIGMRRTTMCTGAMATR
ncbi:MAG: hypothetical protein ACJAYU_004004 [Bradymonadia bacterium]|jgi:hypothetical protein